MTGRSRWVLVVAVVVAYALGLAAIVSWTRKDAAVAVAGGVPSTVVPVPEVTSSGPARLTLPENPRVLVVGDSYAEGWGADPVTEGFAYKIGDLLGWRVTVDGVGSTGYVNQGQRGQGNYRERLVRKHGTSFDLVVLQGGSNDESLPIETVRDAVDQTVTAVHDTYPSAAVVMMGPVAPYGSARASRVKINAVLLRYARDHQLPYLNPIYEKWFVARDRTTYVNLEKGHPNNRGYQRVAQSFAADIEKFSAPAGQ